MLKADKGLRLEAKKIESNEQMSSEDYSCWWD